jgi:hypothetical protein
MQIRTPTTIAGALARIAMFAASPWWNQPLNELDWPEQNRRSLIELLCKAPGSQSHQLPNVHTYTGVASAALGPHPIGGAFSFAAQGAGNSSATDHCYKAEFGTSDCRMVANFRMPGCVHPGPFVCAQGRANQIRSFGLRSSSN